MHSSVDDTIVALSSARGQGRRGIVRVTGPRTRALVESIFIHEEGQPVSLDHRIATGYIRLAKIHSLLPADLYWWQGPRTYTGQDLAEIHTISSPPLLEKLITDLMNAGARAAQPGEFTLRGFLSGRRDLPRSEAIMAVIHARNDTDLKSALVQLAGGMTEPLAGLREDLLNLLADVEAGLDFTDEHIEFVGKDEILLRLGKGLAQLMNLQKKLQTRTVSGRAFRVALAGLPNAGKSSLFNALLNTTAAIISDEPGTTRDYLIHTLHLDDMPVELIDTAGWQSATDTIEAQAQTLGQDVTRQADLILWCVPVTDTQFATTLPLHLQGGDVLPVATKCDLADVRGDFVPTSAIGEPGTEELVEIITEKTRAFVHPPLAPSQSRCRHHVESCLNHLRAAHHLVLFDEPPELFALELRLTLDHLGEMVGAIYHDDLLDRIFSRFCIGK